MKVVKEITNVLEVESKDKRIIQFQKMVAHSPLYIIDIVNYIFNKNFGDNIVSISALENFILFDLKRDMEELNIENIDDERFDFYKE